MALEEGRVRAVRPAMPEPLWPVAVTVGGVEHTMTAKAALALANRIILTVCDRCERAPGRDDPEGGVPVLRSGEEPA